MADGADPVYEALDESIPEEFHFHLYFDPDSRAVRPGRPPAPRPGGDLPLPAPPVRERPMGPHRWPIWSVWVDEPNFGPAALWMMRHHGEHSVLVHPNIDDGLLDHTGHAMWLGAPRPLKLEVFEREH